MQYSKYLILLNMIDFMSLVINLSWHSQLKRDETYIYDEKETNRQRIDNVYNYNNLIW